MAVRALILFDKSHEAVRLYLKVKLRALRRFDGSPKTPDRGRRFAVDHLTGSQIAQVLIRSEHGDHHLRGLLEE